VTFSLIALLTSLARNMVSLSAIFSISKSSARALKSGRLCFSFNSSYSASKSKSSWSWSSMVNWRGEGL